MLEHAPPGELEARRRDMFEQLRARQHEAI
jgi:hypothetical protein